MAYATVSHMRAYLPQLSASPETDALLQEILDRATAQIDTDLGWAFTPATIAAKTAIGSGTHILLLPVHVAGSVTSVTTIPMREVPTYTERDGALIAHVEGIEGASSRRDGPGVWALGVPYTITANWGWASTPKDIEEACLEIAIRMWRARDAGFSDVIGVEGGAVGYTKALPASVARTLEKYRAQARRLL